VSSFTQLNSGAGGLIGLLILFFGMQIAWKLTGTSVRATAVLGPFTQNDAAPAAAAPSSPPPPLG
jgi:hypothetical protein